MSAQKRHLIASTRVHSIEVCLQFKALHRSAPETSCTIAA